MVPQMPNSLPFRRFSVPLSILAGSAWLAACQQAPDQPDNDVAQAPATNLPAIPLPQPPLDRAGLLAAVAQAASATAAGTPLPESVTSLDGRQFEVRIRFGCRGPARDLQEAWLGWTYGAENRTLRVRAKPTISLDDPLVGKIAGEQFESVEGFWIPRPWLQQAVCPARAAVRPQEQQQQDGPESARADGRQEKPEGPEGTEAAAEAAADPVPTAPRIGIAHFYTDEDARTHRRDSRPYSAVKTLPEGTPISSQGFNLVLSGRIRALPGKGVVQCANANADTPPECVVSADFQRVRIEAPETGEIIAEWSTG